MTLERNIYTQEIAVSRPNASSKPASGAASLLVPPGCDLRDITRLVVLVPQSGLWPGWWKPLSDQLDIHAGIEIALVILCDFDGSDRPMRRRMNTQLTLVRRDYPAAYGRLVNRADWVHVLQAFTRKRDLVVCFPQQKLSQALAGALDLPVVEIPQVYPRAGARLLGLLKRAAFNLFPFAVVALFFWIQAQINQQPHDIAYGIALSATVVAEIGVIFVWSLFLG